MSAGIYDLAIIMTDLGLDMVGLPSGGYSKHGTNGMYGQFPVKWKLCMMAQNITTVTSTRSSIHPVFARLSEGVAGNNIFRPSLDYVEQRGCIIQGGGGGHA